MSDTMNNYANNTKAELGGTEHTDFLIYWNFYHVDELITTDWLFYTYIDNLSYLGGLLDIILLVPAFAMAVYTFRLQEINVFFYEQIMSKWKHTDV